MGIKVLIFFVGVLISFFVYKFIAYQLKQSKDESIRIINECKTEIERIEKLNALKKKIIKRSFLYYFVFMIILILVCFCLLFIIRVISHSETKPIGTYELFKESELENIFKNNKIKK